MVFNTPSNTTNIEETHFKVFPNPVKDFLQLEWEGDWNNTQITLYNALGQIITNYHPTANQPIDVSNLSSGTYILEISDGSNRVVKRIVID